MLRPSKTCSVKLKNQLLIIVPDLIIVDPSRALIVKAPVKIFLSFFSENFTNSTIAFLSSSESLLTSKIQSLVFET